MAPTTDDTVDAVGGEARARFAVRLTGSFRLCGRNGEDALPRSRRARALLAYLILTPSHAAPREVLAALLWSERGEKQARASLRQALLELRPLVGPDSLLTVTREEVRLAPAAIATDPARFDQAAGTEDLVALVELFGEPDLTLLGDVPDLDPAFDDWLARQRSQWREARRASALRACHGGAARVPAQALRLAQLVALDDPLDETAAIAVMTCAHAAGDVATIRRTFGVLSQSLRQELGVAPSRATVAAYERLAATAGPPPANDPQPDPGDRGPPPPPRHKISRRTANRVGAAAAAAAGLSLVLGSIGVARGGSRTARPLPGDPAAAALFLQARDDTAERSAGSLDRAVTELQRVNAIQPRFAPAYAALADAYLLAGEAGSLFQAAAFDGADHAADRALAIDPQLSAPHRAKGFVLYWWRHSATAAGVEFRKAIRIDPADALTHFWYANVLADAGEQAAAMREFDRARLADPGSDHIAADYAWALWIFGRDHDARVRLDAIIAAHPGNVEALNCAAAVALAEGDGAAFLTDYGRRAGLRGEPALAAKYRRFADAYRRGGEAGLLAALVSGELVEQRDQPYPDHSDAAFYASLGHDRAALLRILDLAAAAHERWGAAGYVRRERARWAGDPQLLGAIARVTGDRVEG